MTHIEWTEDLHVGLPAIDEQHQKLFAIANDLLTAIENNRGEEVLADVFNELRDYTKYHFKEEEAYMESIGYPEHAVHCAKHSILLVRVGTLQKMIENTGSITPESAAEFLREWITNHIMQDDIKIEQYARSR